MSSVMDGICPIFGLRKILILLDELHFCIYDSLASSNDIYLANMKF